MSYSAKYIDHFSNPRGVGEVDPPDGEGNVKHEGGGCFDNVRLTLKIDDDTITDARFRARACSGTIAACSALCEMVNGMTVDMAKSITPDEIADYLDGVPDKKQHSVALAAEALQEALGLRH